jgi:prepilin-type N-terminal cleavage/methylation domain-containing protein
MNAIESRRMRSKGQSGFTLIELLVVIAILGVLAGVVVFAVGGVTSSANKKACGTEKKTIETAIQAFKADSVTSALPANVSDLTVYLKDPTKAEANFSMNAAAGLTDRVVVQGTTYTVAGGTAGTAAGAYKDVATDCNLGT